MEKSGANTVRIQWYVRYPHPERPAFDIADLDAILEKCRTSRLIPVVELHDCICPSDAELLSAHAYWGGDFDGTSEVEVAVRANLPIVFGEIANKQFANGDECHFGLDGTGLNHPPLTGFPYQQLLILLSQLDIGWFAWAWYKDNCEHRRLTPDGNYTGAMDGSPTGLTPYGEDLLHHATYGLRLGQFAPIRTNSLPGEPPP